MSEIVKQQMCILMRSGVQVWVDKDRASKLMNILGSEKGKLVDIDGEYINTSDIVGVFNPITIEDMTRRKNGEWKCQVAGTWHARGVKCYCLDATRRRQAIENCEKHQESYGSHMVNCQCDEQHTKKT